MFKCLMEYFDFNLPFFILKFVHGTKKVVILIQA